MEKQTKSNWQTQLLFVSIATMLFMLAGNLAAVAQDKYKVGDRVECEITGSLPGKYWRKGTITPFAKGDFGPGGEPDGSWYHFKADANGVEYPCKPEHIRPIAGAATTETQNKVEENNKTKEVIKEDKDDASAEGDFLECPVEQKQVKNGARPNAELLKKIIRCSKGEQPIQPGWKEGAVGVEVTSIQIGASRPWSYSQDIGNSKPGTLVFPVKATYTVTTFYLAATEVSEGWIRILNFYVNAFGEWQIGSEESIRGGKFKRIEK